MLSGLRFDIVSPISGALQNLKNQSPDIISQSYNFIGNHS